MSDQSDREEKDEIEDSMFVEVGQKGIETLKAYCRKRKSFSLLDHLKKIVKRILEKLKSI